MLCSNFLSAWVHAHESSPLGQPTGPVAAELQEHISNCEPCATLACRLRLQAGLLSTLECLTAPPELEARVTELLAQAALDLAVDEPTERVARSLEYLRPVPAPSELEGRVAALLAREHQLPVEPDRRAPDVLDRLVGESLRDLPKAVSAGMLSKLERPAAPADLDQRIHADLAGRAGRPRSRAWLRLAAAASVLAVVGWIALAGLDRSSSAPLVNDLVASGAPQTKSSGLERRYPFRVIEHDSWEDFQAAAPASLVSAARELSGGLHAGGSF